MSDGMTVQVLGNEAGKEDNESYARLMVSNHKGRFHVKFRGAKAEHLTRDLINTLAEGETLASKRLFVELFGEWTTFTRPNSTFKVRYFKAEDYKIVNGPSLELARLRGQAAEALQSAEAFRNAGAVGQAYKVVATYLAELAQVPLDLSEISSIDDDLIGKIADGDEFDPEAAAAAHYARQDALANARAEEEDAAISVSSEPVPGADDDLDDIVISASAADDVAVLEEAAPLVIDDEAAVDYRMLDDLAQSEDASDEALESEEDHSADEAPDAGEDQEETAAQEDDRPEPQRAPVRRSFGLGGRR